jgi:hypothetical protein
LTVGGPGIHTQACVTAEVFALSHYASLLKTAELIWILG